MAWSQNSKLQRYKHYLKSLFVMYNVKCHLCKRVLDPQSFFPKLSGGNHLDDYLVHHINGNHDDNRPKNLSFVHRTCHAEYNWKQRRVK